MAQACLWCAGVNVTITYFLDVISSWCHWAEPAWVELKQRYAGRVTFQWKIALLDASGMPATAAQEEWFYRRSGTINRSPYLLNSGWFEPGWTEYLAPNAVAEAAREMGITEDRVRLAIAHAGLIEGRKFGQWDVSLDAAAAAAGLDRATLESKARSPATEARLRASTTEFHALQVTQRPAFLLEDSIADRAVFSGLVRAAPIAAAIDTMLEDVAAYASWAAHMGPPPTA
jgi:predicted DsbA family dithiol-disulfide isomerase